MKKYTISILISIFVLTGCENKGFKFEETNTSGDTEIITNPEIPRQPTPTNPTIPITPVTPENPDTPTILMIDKYDINETIAKEWYVRIVVEDTTNNMKTGSAQLGQLEDTDTVVKHTLKAIAPFRPTYLDVVFVNPIGVDTGSYKTNFHISDTDADSWEFTVKSHDSNATMILSWRGVYVLAAYIDSENRKRYKEYRSMLNPLLSYMTLTDLTDNTEIPVLLNETVNEYVFSMDGMTERTFRWEVKDTSLRASSRAKTVKNITDEQRLKKLQIEALRKDAKAKPDALERKRLRSIDMMTPPTFEVLVK